jgi:hypothetical protein
MNIVLHARVRAHTKYLYTEHVGLEVMLYTCIQDTWFDSWLDQPAIQTEVFRGFL